MGKPLFLRRAREHSLTLPMKRPHTRNHNHCGWRTAGGNGFHSGAPRRETLLIGVRWGIDLAPHCPSLHRVRIKDPLDASTPLCALSASNADAKLEKNSMAYAVAKQDVRSRVSAGRREFRCAVDTRHTKVVTQGLVNGFKQDAILNDGPQRIPARPVKGFPP